MSTTVREIVASAAAASSRPETRQNHARSPVRARLARYMARGAIIVSAAPRAIGCCAEPRTRSCPRRMFVFASRSMSRNGTYRLRCEKMLLFERDS